MADNFFWLGRYLERLEAAARLLLIAIGRVSRPAPTPHEMAELEVLIDCLAQAGLLNAEAIAGLGTAALGQALLRGCGELGRDPCHARPGVAHDRTAARPGDGRDAAVTARGPARGRGCARRASTTTRGQALDATAQAMSRVLAFSATVAGLAAENMVRGGGRLFLDLGRRVERAQAVADQIACTLEFPGVAQQPARMEHGLRLALELCDSSITYRSRYLAVLQPAPVLDLVLADEGNPRGLAFQLAAMRALLSEIASGGDNALATAAAALQDEPQAMVRSVSDAADQAGAALVPARPPACAARCRRRAVGPCLPSLFRAAADCPHASGSTHRPGHCAAPHDLSRAPHDPLRLPDRRSISARISRICGRARCRHQRVLRAGVHAAPAVSWRREGSDHFGNDVTWLFLDVAACGFRGHRRCEWWTCRSPHRLILLRRRRGRLSPATRWAAGGAAWQAAEFLFDSPRAPANGDAHGVCCGRASRRAARCWRRCST